MTTATNPVRISAPTHRPALRPAPVTTPSPVAPEPPALPIAGLITVLVGVLLPMLDFFIVNVALPTMRHDLHASSALLELVVSGYATAYAVLLVLGGRLGDAQGRRRLFMTGIAAFTIASLLCGLAPTATTLVIARVLQGAAAALMVPQTLSTIQATGNVQSRSRALGWYGRNGRPGGSRRPAARWRADLREHRRKWLARDFLRQRAGGYRGTVLRRSLRPETKAARHHRIDLPGTLLLAVTLVAVLIPMTEGRALGWPIWSVVLLAMAPVGAAVFVAVERNLERKGGSPLVPPSILKHRSMRSGLSLAVPFFTTFGAFMFVYALFVQGTLGFSPLRAGVAMAPMAVIFWGVSLATTRLVARYGRSVIGAVRSSCWLACWC